MKTERITLDVMFVGLLNRKVANVAKLVGAETVENIVDAGRGLKRLSITLNCVADAKQVEDVLSASYPHYEAKL